MNPKIKIDSHWILIRGLAREARHWGSFPQDLERNLNTGSELVRVDTIDLPGTGLFSEMKSPTSIVGITNFVREKFLEIRERQRQNGEIPSSRTYLLAVSLGGMIAVRWMERWPGDLSGVVLVNTSLKGLSPIHHRLLPRAVLQLLKVIHQKDLAQREEQILRLVSHRPEIRAATAKEWAKIQAGRPVSLENFARQLTAAARFSSALTEPPCPVLVVRSVQDQMVSPECSKVIADRWHVPLVEHPSAGHDLPLDAPDWLSEQVQAWALRE